jgi:ABC-type dipeptide/oligopeptide/nickel transport system ATPase subunit
LSEYLSKATVRVFRATNREFELVGTGFLVAERHIITCAHVVASALNQESQSGIPSDPIILDFPILSDDRKFQADVVGWHPVNENPQVGDVEDIAVLKLAQDPPTESQAVPLVELGTEGYDSHFDRQVRVLGFASAAGDFVRGTLQGMDAHGWVQLDQDLGQGLIAKGFSGAAVWDIRENAVSGMVVGFKERDLLRTGCMIPATVLNKALTGTNVITRKRNPYKGLETFSEEDSPYYFGREKAIKAVLERMINASYLQIVGVSGSGKSSLINAGVIPELRKNPELSIAQMRPKGDVIRNMASALLPLVYEDRLDQISRLQQTIKDITNGNTTLSDIVPLALQNLQSKHLILFIDQFEEIFSLNGEKHQSIFISNVIAAIREVNVTVVVAVRADFVSKMMKFHDLVSVINENAEFKLTTMSNEDYKNVIVQPALVAGVRFDSGLPELIVSCLGESPSNIALLEFALTKLWENQSGGIISRQSYDEIGGVNQCLVNYAEEVYANTKPHDQIKMQYILTQLVKPSDNGSDTKLITPYSKFDQNNYKLISKLVDKRLLLINYDNVSRDNNVELVHEELIKQWDRLRGWVESNRDFRIWQEELRRDINRYNEYKGKKNAPLLRNPVLKTALDWKKKRFNDILDEEIDFIEESNRKHGLASKIRKAVGSFIALCFLSLAMFVFYFGEDIKSEIYNEYDFSRKTTSNRFVVFNTSDITYNKTICKIRDMNYVAKDGMFHVDLQWESYPKTYNWAEIVLDHDIPDSHYYATVSYKSISNLTTLELLGIKVGLLVSPDFKAYGIWELISEGDEIKEKFTGGIKLDQKKYKIKKYWNSLSIYQRDDKVRFYINNVWLRNYTLIRKPGPGRVTLFVKAGKNTNAEFKFDKLSLHLFERSIINKIVDEDWGILSEMLK